MKLSKPHINTAKSEAILKAAKALFLKNGYAATTMDDVAKKAGLTKQTVYSYYRNKDVLFQVMILSLCERKTPADADYIPDDVPFETLMTNIGSKLLDLITSAEVLATTRLVIAESERHPKVAKAYYESGTQQIVHMISGFLQVMNKRGVTAIPNTESAASYFLAMIKGQHYVRMILRVKPASSEAMKLAHVKECVRIFVALFCSKNPLVTKSTL